MKKITHSPFDPFVQWFFPKLLRFVPKWMSANMISVLGILLSFLAGLSLAISGFFDPKVAPWIYMLGGIFVFITWVTDTMDGIVARDRGQTSKLGHYLDHFGDSLQVLFIGTGLFLTNNSHIVIGLTCCVVYLLWHVEGHIKVNILNELSLPFFGPTEIRFVIVVAILGQALIDFGMPLSWEWIQPLTGVVRDSAGAIVQKGFFPKLLNFNSGLTFIDLGGLIASIAAFIGLIAQTLSVVVRLRKLDNKGTK